MRYWIIALVIDLAVMITTGCNYHLHDTIAKVPTEMKTIILNSYDSCGSFTRAVREELRLNDIMLVDDVQNKNNTNNTLPSLRIINSSENQVTTSVFQDGKTAEYLMTLIVQAQILMPGKDYYPIDIKIYRSFFDNPLTALAKDAERNIICQEMRQQAAQQLVRKMLTVYTSKEVKRYAKLKQQQSPHLAVSASV